MEYFKNIDLNDRYLFEKYLCKINNKSYEYSFTTLYLWKDFCKIEYSIINNCLILKKETQNGEFFMMPLGYEKDKLNNLIFTLKKLSTNNNIYLFGDIEDNFINDLQNYTDLSFKITQDRDNFEYIYSTDKLLNLSGEKYHKKKNHYNSFINSYNYTIKSINDEKSILDCLNLLKKWHKNKNILCEELLCETKEITNLLYNLDFLNLKTIAVYVNNNLAGFSIGEILNDTAIIHIERCDIKYKGIYAFINREFINKEFRSTKYINREEDCGYPGLRKSKLSYHPIYFLKKSLIII